MRWTLASCLCFGTGLLASAAAAEEYTIPPARLRLDVQPEVAPAPEQPTAPAPPPPPSSWLEGWDGSVAVGLNGSDGNTERLSFRAGLDALRKTPKIETRLNSSYTYAQD